jgi:aryl carrier-like protein
VRVLERLEPLVKEGGTIFIGDIRSLPLHEAFHTSVVLEQAPAALDADEVRRRIRQRLQRDNELVLDPAFFRALPQQFRRIGMVTVHLKRGRSRNELTRFRYDVVLGIGRHTGEQGGVSVPSLGALTQPRSPRPESGAGITLNQVRERLASESPVIAMTGLANPRLTEAVRAVELLASDACPETAGAIRRRLSAEPETGIDPEDLYGLATPYEIELSWSETALDRYDTVFRHRSAPLLTQPRLPVVSRKAWNEYTNRPSERPSPSSLALELRELVKERLPEFMVPATIIVLDQLPRAPNGKIDRKGLPQPDAERALTTTRYVAPETELERIISGVWQELLQLERVGKHDNFFDLGANSLLMVQANSRLRAALRRDLTLVDLFRYPTVNALATYLSQNAPESSALTQSQERGRTRIDALQRRRVASQR